MPVSWRACPCLACSLLFTIAFVLYGCVDNDGGRGISGGSGESGSGGGGGDSTPVAIHGFLKVSDGKIVDENGKQTQLRGMSFFWSQWMGQYWTAGVVETLAKDWKVSLVRASVGIKGRESGYLVNSDEEMEKLVTVIDASIANGIYVLVDWHDHHAEDHIAEAKAFFSLVAEKYGSLPNVLFEPYNEPLDVAWSAVIKPYHEEIVTEIRKHSQNIIVLGTRNWCQEVDEAAADPVDGENLAYCLHFYASTHKGSYRNKAQGALDKGKAVFASEWGTCEADGNGALDISSVATWHDWMDQNSISSANWAISDKDESCSALIPGASAQGAWGGEQQLTPSGVWVRNKIIKGINGADGGSGGGGGGGASDNGCCKFEGSATCGNCGDDGTGWCHGSANNCNTCTGTFDDSAQKPTCAR